MAAIRSQRQAVAEKEWADMAAKLAPAKRSNDRDQIMLAMIGLLTEDLVALRLVPAERGMALAIRLSNDEAAKSAAERLPLPTVVSGSWMIINPDDRGGSGARDLQLAIGAKAWDPMRKEWVAPPTAAEVAAAVKDRADKAAAAARINILKSMMFPAQVQFQAGGYVDQDGNGRGSYGFISEMSGGSIPETTKVLQLMPAAFHAVNPVKDGQTFAVYLPGADMSSGVGSRAQIAKLPLNQDGIPQGEELREQWWVAYAWPTTGTSGTMFAINAGGTVYQHAWTGETPAWNALWADGGEPWKGKPGAGWTPAPRP
jgi:hypothetical protein